MRKPDFCQYAKTKVQITELCSNSTADQRLCFRYMNSTKVQLGNDQEMTQSERKIKLHKPSGGKKIKMTLRYVYQENIS